MIVGLVHVFLYDRRFIIDILIINKDITTKNVALYGTQINYPYRGGRDLEGLLL